MKKVLNYLLDYQRKYFDRKLYLSIGIFATFCIVVNYTYDFEDNIIDSYSGEPVQWLWMFLFHGLPFLFVCLLLHIFKKKQHWLTSGEFWLKFLIGFGLLALDRSFYGYYRLSTYFNPQDWYFVIKCINWASSLLVSVIPMLLLYPILEKDDPKIWYGLQWKKFDMNPYLILLGITAVFIGIGSFIGELKDYYPRYNHSFANLYLENHPNTSEWQTVALYELCYGTNFISVELIFRGFLIFAFTRTLGPYAVLPMMITYAFLHFGKPLSETISSIFGGYVLGIISYNSRNIWGGIFIHLGVAWLMELFGWLQNLR